MSITEQSMILSLLIPPLNLYSLQKKYENIPIPYKEPSWSGIADIPYHLEVLKMGKILETIKLDTKPFLVFGRLPTCDVPMEHPSLSRFHAVLQYRFESWTEAVDIFRWHNPPYVPLISLFFHFPQGYG